MPTEHNSWREKSKLNWGSYLEPGQHLCDGQIQAGAILRIADALEVFVNQKLRDLPEYQQLLKDKDWYESLAADRRKHIQFQEKRIAGLKGQITKLKKNMGK